MKKHKKFKNRYFLFILLFSTSLISLKTLKKVEIQDIKIYGSELFSKTDVVNNSSLKLPIRLIFIKTNFLEKELKQNLSLKNISVSRQILPFGLKVNIHTRTPIAFGERILNGEKIFGFIDINGIFINKENAEINNFNKLTIKVIGWEEKFKKILSTILNSQENYDFEIVKVTFSSNGFITIEEKDLKTIFLGSNPNLINYQLEIMNNLKIEFNNNKIPTKIENIDLTDPNKPIIKVFKP